MTKFYDGSKLLSIEMTDTANGAHFELISSRPVASSTTPIWTLTRSRTSSIWPITPRATLTAPTATSTTPSMRTAMS